MYALESLHYRVTEQLTHRFVHSFCGNVACGGENNTNLPMIYRRCQPGLAGLCSLRGRRIWCRLPSPRRRRQSEIYYRPNRLDRNSERWSLSKIAQPFSSMQSSFTDAATTLPTTMSQPWLSSSFVSNSAAPVPRTQRLLQESRLLTLNI
jgi:hypothetical protein